MSTGDTTLTNQKREVIKNDSDFNNSNYRGSGNDNNRNYQHNILIDNVV